mgnify:CR=1 FL=1
MTLASRIDVPNSKKTKNADVVFGDDWVAPHVTSESEVRERRARRGLISINRSPLARKIVTFNLVVLTLLVGGILFLNPFRDSLVVQRELGLVAEAELIAGVLEVQLDINQQDGGVTDQSLNASAILKSLDLHPGVEVYVFDPKENLLATTVGAERSVPSPVDGLQLRGRSTIITEFLNSVFDGISGLLAPSSTLESAHDPEVHVRGLVTSTMGGSTQVNTTHDEEGQTIFSVATPIIKNGVAVGVVAMSSAAGEIDSLVRSEREQVLQMFIIAILVSIGLSLVLASTIANPLADLAAAAEVGRDKNSRKVSPGRVRIPDLTGRPDEIGRLSGALRGMVSALYERIDANEQFAADVAHELKNPLASLRSAVGTMRIAKREEQRERLLDVIEHDVRRLDRLVTDISNASRLDSELVKEEEETFDLTKMMTSINEYLGGEAATKGVEFISDLPKDPITLQGLEARLAQVFVNLISNAISFCDEGDAIRVWARKRENRVLVVVEDTGPGIPEQALSKIFNRFYTSRPVGQFGDNSGLGLAISKQIVEAHGGVIWAENIRPTDADVTSEPLGARFVVGIPV